MATGGAVVTGDRWAFLADASRALAGTLNLRRTMTRACTLAVPTLGDAAAVVLVTAAGTRRACAGPDSSSYDERADRQPAHPVAERVLRTGRSVDVPEVDARTLEGVGLTPDVAPAAAARDLVVVPLVARGSVVGILSLVRPAGGAVDHPLLEDFAHRVAVALDTARVYDERSRLAATLRASLLQPELPDVPGVRIGATYRPAQEATEIGGDFYDLYPARDGTWAFVLGDVCGKGVPAAVLTGQCRQSLRTATLVHEAPVDVVGLLNRAMIATDGSRFVTAVYGVLRPAPSGAVHASLTGGGHPLPLVLRADGAVETVDARGTIIGMLPEARFGQAELTLGPDETLVLFTDGVVEARRDGEQLGRARLESLLADCAGMPAQAVADRVEQLALDYLGGRAHDDIAVLAIQPDREGAR